jgi:cyclic pyranopterin phosphate synthase
MREQEVLAPVALDRFNRPLASLRISVTDRCNMRCQYCMPEQDYVWLPRTSILSFEEIDRLAGIFAGLGVRKLRLTGGEPLLRHDLSSLVRRLAAQPEIGDLALTTNGILLGPQAAVLASAGLRRVTVSLDTLRPDRMQAFSRSPRHQDVLDGLAAAARAGFSSIKLNSVIIRGYNDDELEALLDFAGGVGAEIRFIEYMDVGGATAWRMADVVSRREMLGRFTRRYGPLEPVEGGDDPRAPAQRFRLQDGRTFGIIASTTAPFCRSCDRARLTADGQLLLCLYGDQGLDLRALLRSAASDGDIETAIREVWSGREDRGAEVRLSRPQRGALYQLEALKLDPHREMHTRGG